MTRKQIDQSRELRLWATQVITPAAIAVIAVLKIPGAKEFVVNKFNEIRDSVKNKFNR